MMGRIDGVLKRFCCGCLYRLLKGFAIAKLEKKHEDFLSQCLTWIESVQIPVLKKEGDQKLMPAEHLLAFQLSPSPYSPRTCAYLG
jgi:hypothetical protein